MPIGSSYCKEKKLFKSTKTELGKSVKKDLNDNKLTFYTLLGEEGAQKMANTTYLDAINAIKVVPNSEILVDFAKYVLERKN